VLWHTPIESDGFASFARRPVRLRRWRSRAGDIKQPCGPNPRPGHGDQLNHRPLLFTRQIFHSFDVWGRRDASLYYLARNIRKPGVRRKKGQDGIIPCSNIGGRSIAYSQEACLDRHGVTDAFGRVQYLSRKVIEFAGAVSGGTLQRRELVRFDS